METERLEKPKSWEAKQYKKEADKFLKERNILLAALQRISEGTVAWLDEDATEIIESVGIAANEAIGKVMKMEGTH